jgi:hypothetical protein
MKRREFLIGSAGFAGLGLTSLLPHRAVATPCPPPVLRVDGGTTAFTSCGSSGDNLFVADFSNPNANGSNLYNFANRLGTVDTGEQRDGQTNCRYEHLATGGPGGMPCVRFTQYATRYQYGMGYDTPSLGGSWALGDEIFYRFAIRIEEGTRFNASASGGKFIDHGSGSGRNIVWLSAPYEVGGGGGTLGWPGGEGGGSRAVPSYFGLSGSNGAAWINAPHTGLYGSCQVSRGVGWKAAEPPLITAADNPVQPSPGPSSAPPTDGWYYGQVRARAGNDPGGGAPQCSYTVWVNNNTLGSPTSQQYTWNAGAEPGGLSPSSWVNGPRIGNYVGGGSASWSPTDFIWRLAKFEVGRSFRSDWYPGA